MLSERKESLLTFQRKFTFFSSLNILKYLFVCMLQLCGLKTATNPTELIVLQLALNLYLRPEHMHENVCRKLKKPLPFCRNTLYFCPNQNLKASALLGPNQMIFP